MLEIVVITLMILFISLKLEKITKIASPVIIFSLSMLIIGLTGHSLIHINISEFSEEMTVFIVLLVLVDAFILKFKDLKKNYISLLYLAGVAIILSTLIGIYILDYTIFEKYNLTIGGIIVLFAMCLATDPVAVVATFKQYNIPHKLAFLAEGESLFNDAVALIIFSSFGIFLLNGGKLSISYGVSISTYVIFSSIIVGILIGLIGLLLMKSTKDTLTELVSVLLIAYLSFYIAEHFLHASGLLAEIVAIITLTTIVEKSYDLSKKEIKKDEKRIENINGKRSTILVKKILTNITNINRQKDILSYLSSFALFINVFLFMSLASITNIDLLIHYWKEIVTMFVLTTIIRMMMMTKFLLLSKRFDSIEKIDISGFFVLVFSGIKGGLSIVMLHMLNVTVPNFEYLEMFTAIVSGVIIMSMFIYTFGLIITIKLNKTKFNKEVELEKKEH